MSNVIQLQQWLDKKKPPQIFLDYLDTRPPTVSPDPPENPIQGDLWWKQNSIGGGVMFCWNEKEYQWIPIPLEKEK